MACPCGLTREELLSTGWFKNDTGLCKAPFKLKGVTTHGCGELYTSHPSAQGKSPTSHHLYIVK